MFTQRLAIYAYHNESAPPQIRESSEAKGEQVMRTPEEFEEWIFVLFDCGLL